MGSLAADEPVGEKKREINVLVTGFGPFLDNHTNPSYLIARSLPAKHLVANLPPINIHAQPTPLEVSYDTILKTVPKLLFSPTKDTTITTSPTAPEIHDPVSAPPPDRTRPLHPPHPSKPDHPNYDIVLNLGMATGRTYYALETTAHRSGYTKPDIHGRTPPASDPWNNNNNDDDDDATTPPALLLSTFHTDDVCRRWNAAPRTAHLDLRTSNDPGRYLCDFTYYACMLEYWKREREGARPCLFLHVPAGCGEEDVRWGREVALGLVAAVVGSEMGV